VEGRRVSVAEGKRDFTRLLREVRESRQPVLIYDYREHVPAGVLVSPDEYDRYTSMRAYLEAVRISEATKRLKLDATRLARRSRRDLETRQR